MKRAATLCYVLLMASPLLANPKGAVVKSGKGSIKQSGSTVEVTASDRALIHWQDFSIGKGETTRFIQPSAKSVVVNKVTGQMPSTIAGLLEANGKVALINPHGVMVTKDGVIRTAGFIASTSDLLTNDQGEFIYRGDDYFSGIDPMAAINLDGIIEVSSQGEITTFAPSVTVSGSLTTPSGTVHILGDKVEVKSSAVIDTSSTSSGGNIFIGGDALRDKSVLYAAQHTLVEPGASINASCTSVGDGGKIIVWGDKTAKAYGTFQAKGGSLSGKGGFVEVSSCWVDIEGIQVSTLGKERSDTGTFIIDPYNIMINAGASTNENINDDNNTYTATGSNAVIYSVPLTTALDASNVIVSTIGGAGEGNGDITLNTSILSSQGHNITLQAAGTITLQEGCTIALNGGGDISLIGKNVIFALGLASPAAINTEGGSGNILIKTDQTNGIFSFPSNPELMVSSTITNNNSQGKINIYIAATGNTLEGNIMYNNDPFPANSPQYFRQGNYNPSDPFPAGTGWPFTIFFGSGSSTSALPSSITYTTNTTIANQAQTLYYDTSMGKFLPSLPKEIRYADIPKYFTITSISEEQLANPNIIMLIILDDITKKNQVTPIHYYQTIFLSTIGVYQKNLELIDAMNLLRNFYLGALNINSSFADYYKNTTANNRNDIDMAYSIAKKYGFVE